MLHLQCLVWIEKSDGRANLIGREQFPMLHSDTHHTFFSIPLQHYRFARVEGHAQELVDVDVCACARVLVLVEGLLPSEDERSSLLQPLVEPRRNPHCRAPIAECCAKKFLLAIIEPLQNRKRRAHVSEQCRRRRAYKLQGIVKLVLGVRKEVLRRKTHVLRELKRPLMLADSDENEAVAVFSFFEQRHHLF